MTTGRSMRCGECGAHLRDPGEFHPYAFCQMIKRRLDPWTVTREMHPGRLTLHAPLLREKSPTFIDSLMAMAANAEKATRPKAAR